MDTHQHCRLLLNVNSIELYTTTFSVHWPMSVLRLSSKDSAARFEARLHIHTNHPVRECILQGNKSNRNSAHMLLGHQALLNDDLSV